MSELDDARWKAAYPALAEASRKRSDLTPDIRAELAPDLSDGDFEAGVQGVSRYLRHLASSDRDLIYEEYFLVLSLAAEACVIHALAPKAVEAKRGEIEADLRHLISPFRKWLGGDLQRAHAAFLDRWPFPDLMRRQSANDTTGSTN